MTGDPVLHVIDNDNAARDGSMRWLRAYS